MCSRKKVFIKDSMLKRKKVSFLFLWLPWLSNELLWSINKLKEWLWCTIWLSYIQYIFYIYIVFYIIYIIIYIYYLLYYIYIFILKDFTFTFICLIDLFNFNFHNCFLFVYYYSESVDLFGKKEIPLIDAF